MPSRPNAASGRDQTPTLEAVSSRRRYRSGEGPAVILLQTPSITGDGQARRSRRSAASGRVRPWSRVSKSRHASRKQCSRGVRDEHPELCSRGNSSPAPARPPLPGCPPLSLARGSTVLGRGRRHGCACRGFALAWRSYPVVGVAFSSQPSLPFARNSSARSRDRSDRSLARGLRAAYRPTRDPTSASAFRYTTTISPDRRVERSPAPRAGLIFTARCQETAPRSSPTHRQEP